MTSGLRGRAEKSIKSELTDRDLGWRRNMQLVIEKFEYQEKILIVTGKTSIGMIKGIWKNEKEPAIGEKYFVELSIDMPIERKVRKEDLSSSVVLDNENVIFVGLCEDIDNEVYYLRFDIDWLDMLDIKAIASKKKKGDYISFSSNWRNIEIYAY